MTLRGELIGFIVQELPNDASIAHVLQQEGILYPTWDAAMNAASLLANGLSEKYNSKLMCILRTSSRNACLENGFTTSHRLQDWRCDVVIISQYKPLKIMAAKN